MTLLRRKEFEKCLGMTRTTLLHYQKTLPGLFSPAGRNGQGGGRGKRGTTTVYHEYQLRVAQQYIQGAMTAEEATALWELFKQREINELYAMAGDTTRRAS